MFGSISFGFCYVFDCNEHSGFNISSIIQKMCSISCEVVFKSPSGRRFWSKFYLRLIFPHRSGKYLGKEGSDV